MNNPNDNQGNFTGNKNEVDDQSGYSYNNGQTAANNNFSEYPDKEYNNVEGNPESDNYYANNNNFQATNDSLNNNSYQDDGTAGDSFDSFRPESANDNNYNYNYNYDNDYRYNMWDSAAHEGVNNYQGQTQEPAQNQAPADSAYYQNNYSQEQGKQFNPQAGEFKQNPEQGQYNPYQQAPVQPQNNNEPSQFQILWKEYCSWLKKVFSAKPSSSVVLARASEHKWTWAIGLVLMMIVGAFTGLFNSLVSAKILGGGYVTSRFFGGMFIAALMYGVILLVFVIAQASAKNLHRWYEPFNAATAASVPTTCALVLGMIFGSFSNYSLLVVNVIFHTFALVMTLVMVFEPIKAELSDRKGEEWIKIGLLSLYIGLTVALQFFFFNTAALHSVMTFADIF